jgi:phosphopentomutase
MNFICSSEREHDIGKKSYLKSASLKNCSEHDIGTKKVIFITQRAYRFLCIAINARTIQRAIIYQQCKRLKKMCLRAGQNSRRFFKRFCVKNPIFKIFHISKRSSPVRWGNVLQGSSRVRW